MEKSNKITTLPPSEGFDDSFEKELRKKRAAERRMKRATGDAMAQDAALEN